MRDGVLFPSPSMMAEHVKYSFVRAEGERTGLRRAPRRMVERDGWVGALPGAHQQRRERVDGQAQHRRAVMAGDVRSCL